MRRTAVLGVTAIVALVLLAFVAFHDAVVLAVIRSVATPLGYTVDVERLETSLTTAVATGTTVTNRAGEPVFDATRIEAHYSLRDLLPGSRHRFGLTALDIERPKLVLIHHPDGSYNVALPGAGAAPSRPDTTPIDVRARIRDGSVLLIDRFVEPGHERRQRIVGLAVDARLAPHTHSFYDARFDLDDGRALYPVIGKATFESDRGFEAQRWTAAALPIGPLIDFVLPSHAIDLVGGTLRDVNARVYTFVAADGSARTHVGARAQLDGGTLDVAALAKPLRDATGPIFAYDNGLTTTGIDASLAGVPLHLTGGIFDLSAPQVRFALTGRGSLAALRGLTAATRRLPAAGDLTFAFHALGSATTPLVLGTFSAPSMRYGAYRVDAPSADIAVQGTQLDVLGARLGYGPLTARARGSVALTRELSTDLVASIVGDGDRLPYVPQLVPGLRLNAVAHVSGSGSRLATNGLVYGAGRDGRLDAFIALDGGGNGTVGPLVVERSDGASLYMRVALDRRHDAGAGIASIRRLSLLPARRAALPGITLAALPALAGTLDGAFAGTVDRGRLSAAAGHADLAGLRVGALAGSARADLAAARDGTLHARFRGRTNVGDLDGAATLEDGLVAVDGRLRSSFERLRPIAPRLEARGGIDVPLRALTDGATSAVQIDGARFLAAVVDGVPLRDAEATVVVRTGDVDVRAARLGVAGGSVVAHGRIGSDDDLVASTSGLRLGTPLAGIAAGTLRAHLHARGRSSAPQVDVGLVIDGARVHGIDVDGNATATYDAGTLAVDDATALAAGAYATARGVVRNIGRGTPAIDVTANVHGAQIAALDRVYPLPLRYPDGEIDADVHAGGSLSAPRIAADVRIPAGSLNGLAFRDAHVAVTGDPADLAVRGGTVRVGTTTVEFTGDLSRTRQRVHVRAPRVDLSDFDDYFDSAETLAGRGHVGLDASVAPAAVRTTGDIGIEGARVRRFALGSATATWSTRGRTIHALAGVRGAHGNAALVADVQLPASEPFRDVSHRIAVDASGTLGAFDLASWLPAAGLTLPVAGLLAARARVHGMPSAPTFALRAGVTNGVVAGYHLDALSLTADGDRASAHLASLHLAGPGLVADANGSAGFGARDPLALELRARSDDLPVLERAAGLKLTVGGSASTDARLSGTRVAPRIAQTLDAANLSYDHYTIPRVHGDVAVDAQTLALNAFEADLTSGTLSASASLPISLARSNLGLRNAPLHATLRADAIDLAQFASVLPAGSKLAGTLAGGVVASGTPRAPSIDGSLALAGGSYSSNLVRSPFTNARARLTFTREQAQLSDVHADVGGGSIDGNGNATFGDVRDLRRTLALNAQLDARNAGLDINPYLRGKANGTITAVKVAARRNTTIGGEVAFSQTRIPLTALLPSGTPNPQSTAAPLPVAFDFTVQAGNDVRVQGAGVDIGARGAVTVGGTLAAPTLAGSLNATDGRLSFYRTFTLQQGSSVSFAPSDGIIPNVDATATTRISNPDTDILLHVTGPATNLNLDLASNPTYDKEQILGLLVNAQALGAVSGVQTAQNGGGNGFNAANLAGGYLSSEFTQSLLEPLGSQLGSSLGLSNLALGYDYGSGFSAGASRALGKNLSASVHQTFGTDQRTIVGLNYALARQTALQFSLFSAGLQSPRLGVLNSFLGQDPFTPPNYTLQALQPPPGVSGYVFTYQRKYP